MMDFDHPNVLKLLGVSFDTETNFPIILLPYMAHGDLKTYLVRKRGENNIDVLPEVCVWLHVTCVSVFLWSIVRSTCKSMVKRNCVLKDVCNAIKRYNSTS